MNACLKETLSQFKKKKLLYGFAWLRSFHANYEMIEQLVPRRGYVIDVGCGYGIFADYLARMSPGREVIGLEPNKRKRASAPRNLPNLSFREQLLESFPDDYAEAIILYHVLHHLDSFESQEKLIHLAERILRPGGALVIVEVDRKPFWKFVVAWLVDHLLYLGDRIFYRQADEFKKVILSNGKFSVEQFRCDQKAPFSHVAFVAKKGVLKHA